MTRSVLISFIIALAVAAWVYSGQLGENTEAGAANTSVLDTRAARQRLPVLVRTERVVAVERGREVTVRGRTEAKRSVDLRAETSGRVVEILVRKGALVAQGEVIVRIDMDDREARLAEAVARVHQRQLEFDASRRLNERGVRSATKLAEAAAERDKALAYQAQVEIDIGNTEVVAPFAGVLETRPVEVGDVLTRGSVVAHIVDQDPFLVVGHVSERDVQRIRVGDPGVARLVNGETIHGRVSFIATTAESQTRTFRVELEVPNPGGRLRDGLTSEISIPIERQLAHLLSSAALTLNDEGVLGVRIVVPENTVRFVPVKIIDDTAEGMWLSGLPEVADLITVGQEFVRDGDRVRTSSEPEPTS